MAKTVDDYIAQADRWRDEIARLRAILLDVGLEETVKWGNPCYTLDGRNVVGIGAFKSCFGLWFFQGALLADPAKRLVNAQPGKTRAMRQWRMQSAADIRPRLVRQYASEAAELAARGREIRPRRRPAASLPPESRPHSARIMPRVPPSTSSRRGGAASSPSSLPARSARKPASAASPVRCPSFARAGG